MKLIKKLIAISILLFLFMPVISSLIIVYNADTSSVARHNINSSELILDESVPLGIGESGVCIQAFNMINEYRTQNGAQPLLWSKDLEVAASVRAIESEQCWSHTRPNGQPWYTVNPSIMYGENLARGYNDADSLVAGWQASPAHNENLLFRDFKYAAIVEYNGHYALEFA